MLTSRSDQEMNVLSMDTLHHRFQQFQKTVWFNLFCYLWTGLFSFLAFAPISLSHFVWIAPFGLFWLSLKYHGSYKKLFYHGLLIGVVFYSISFHWIIHMSITFGNFPYPVAVLILLFAGLLFSLKFPIFMLSFSFLSGKIGRHSVWVAGFCGLLSELIGPQLFPWYWGNLAAGNLILAQNVEITGVYGISFLVFVVSYTLFQSNPWHWKEIFRSKEKRNQYLRFIAFPSLLLLAFIVSGIILFKKWENVKPVKSLNVLVIQPDAPLSFRDGREVKESIEALMARIERLAEEGVVRMGKKPDLIVLPEAGVPFFSAHNTPVTTIARRLYWHRFDSLMFLLANKYKANVFFNEIDAGYKGTPGSRNLRYYNNNVLYDPNGDRRDAYQKKFLLMFGEYMPFDFLYDLSQQTGRFEPGLTHNLIRYYTPEDKDKSPKGLHLGWIDTENLNHETVRSYYEPAKTELKEAGKFLPLICYEVILPEFVREFRTAGNPEFIANLTNDKWYGTTTESDQHMELGRLRSIELRRWMVRSTNSGITANIDHLGRFVGGKKTGLMTAETLSETIDVIDSPPTFYTQYGNLIPWVMLGLTGIYYLNLLIGIKKGNKGIS
ncbi:apolipoprotein N-acyltransferase [Leptospira gomenensis]|uniref:Apolipoprotein N-acyltransferase n=1 Tax=Leptospira gomenensis TaxID=2484974 RepID=A0A5F1YPJ7_9LEPT|nr:nitrilase-related carbon-nitrogen hydrolase [Leptospira gomenensis]TGK28199.1 apolipoprotein N-acyltransferase [Leptospira gomenensis]TGK36947.1 apolipoprotein N-acyltransferase [Leptospira gomenensis]TGK45584.1 apolipoprotein N-acyltransferase [Leptospira gomenensis]TGK59523.1 apolipoprotein N-acyltransferase [Leptospira gomenensis]